MLDITGNPMVCACECSVHTQICAQTPVVAVLSADYPVCQECFDSLEIDMVNGSFGMFDAPYDQMIWHKADIG